MCKRVYLLIEFLALYAGVPVALRFLAPNMFVLPVLWFVAVIVWLFLRTDPSFQSLSIWRTEEWRPALRRILIRFAILGPGMVVLVLTSLPTHFLELVRTKPMLWLAVLVLYPVFSVLPQGIIYRVFLFHRYRNLACGPLLYLLGAAAFAVGHLPFGNEWALGLTLVGALLFNDTYRRSHSMLLSSFEHALYGWVIFTLGFGRWFYHGSFYAAQVLTN